jgi:hypothetical protein
MYGIVKKSDGKYYTSMIFGYYYSVDATDEYEQYLQRIYNQAYFVLNEDKTKLVKKPIFEKDNRYLDPQVLVTDSDDSDWIYSDERNGLVDFLTEFKDCDIENQLPNYVLQKCIDLDATYHYIEYPEIRTKTDIQNFMTVTGGMHDARIENVEEVDGNSIHVTFEGVWGAKLEIWFAGDVSYDIEGRNPKYCDPYWFDGSVFFQDGFVWLVDDENIESLDEPIETTGYVWFKARKMTYHITPDKSQDAQIL